MSNGNSRRRNAEEALRLLACDARVMAYAGGDVVVNISNLLLMAQDLREGRRDTADIAADLIKVASGLRHEGRVRAIVATMLDDVRESS